MSEPKFGDIYEWRPLHPTPTPDRGIVVMYVGPYDKAMDSALILAMATPDERLNQVESVWRITNHPAWSLIDNG
jgi:hypothetical protein